MKINKKIYIYYMFLTIQLKNRSFTICSDKKIHREQSNINKSMTIE